MNTKHRWYDVIVAWASGEKIQFNTCNEGWVDYVPYAENSVPAFNCNEFCWRIKPKTTIKRYRMALINTPNDEDKPVALDLADYSLDFPAEQEVHGFIRWIGDMVEVEIEV